jgi:DNA polymerase I
MKIYNRWQDLPFAEIWVADTEFYPGPGLANGGREGDLPTPLCLCAYEMRSGRTTRRWQDELGPFPPYRLDESTLFVAFANGAEFGFHLAMGWGRPVHSIDAHVEFRHHTNHGWIKAADRPKGFYSLPGAVRYFGGDAIDSATKDEMRDRIMQGPPFTEAESAGILEYCAGDVDMLARLLPHLVPTIPSLPAALQRSKFVWATAQQERRGIPVDLPKLELVRNRWEDIKVDLVTEMDRPYGCYEIVDGVAHWRKERFAEYLRINNIPWPRLESGALDETAKTFSEAARAHPALDNLAELRSTLSQLRLAKLSVGRDGRNRTPLWPFGTKTGRKAPSASQYLFGPAKWIRSFITPATGRALIHRDYSQQEAVIAAVLSGDPELLAACETGDVYLGIAKQLGLAPEDATKDTHKDSRLSRSAFSTGSAPSHWRSVSACRFTRRPRYWRG